MRAVEDKQRLFRLIKSVGGGGVKAPSGAMDLMDLEASERGRPPATRVAAVPSPPPRVDFPGPRALMLFVGGDASGAFAHRPSLAYHTWHPSYRIRRLARRLRLLLVVASPASARWRSGPAGGRDPPASLFLAIFTHFSTPLSPPSLSAPHQGDDGDLLDGDLAGTDPHAAAAAMAASPPQAGGPVPLPHGGGLPPEILNMPKIRVIVRKRPLNRKEANAGETDVISVDSARGGLVLAETKTRVDLSKYVEHHRFSFDVTLDEDVANEEVYRASVRPLIETLFHRGKSTVFAYGQTGSGKTHTMQPLPRRATRDILARLPAVAGGAALFVSYFEIYGGKARTVWDVLAPCSPFLLLPLSPPPLLPLFTRRSLIF